MAGSFEERVPTYDGDPAGFQKYCKKARRYLESTKYSERYLCGPRLEARLTSKAEASVETCRAGWLSHPDGVERLLEFLRKKCARQVLPDAGNRLTSFFYRLRRRRGEHMSAWTTRHQNEYEELKKALSRIDVPGAPAATS